MTNHFYLYNREKKVLLLAKGLMDNNASLLESLNEYNGNNTVAFCISPSSSSSVSSSSSSSEEEEEEKEGEGNNDDDNFFKVTIPSMEIEVPVYLNFQNFLKKTDKSLKNVINDMEKISKKILVLNERLVVIEEKNNQLFEIITSLHQRMKQFSNSITL